MPEQDLAKMIQSSPGYPVLLAMMERRFSDLTISTAVSAMALHSDYQKAAGMLRDCLDRPNVTEKEFWRYLQDEVMEKQQV